MFIKTIVYAPYVCTVPSGGVKAIKCYPDAKTFIICGNHIGYSLRERTLILPLLISKEDAEIAKKEIESIPLSMYKIQWKEITRQLKEK